ncbi:dolichol-phosphate mannosyltransferase [Methanosarcinales archaeon]|nr:glycosyltransferase family 2 protein [Candidatus Methanoperedens sp. BLZ2]KAB2946242.1 MAG: glycosyltransferase family 2 protein [Candidatus Methanoperedens sp.]MBZ0176384.1 glycosyltransferase family 2 protein [Candidatus Methanoperedens nitroreducens]CAG0998701.1 dolichol-phosphate mannosyltransferase [Methanosarcinales archaeon]MCX9076720.1 glycosyltransferase family 2 protein [Candidatus Methanoperedens sp.]MCX9088897.1 glycosyltransferase family 2 protein [Candidatus Methanoperedens sp
MSLMDKKKQMKKISVVIPTMNESKNIKEVFSNIPDFVDEIVVVDGNSTDGTREEIKKYRSDTKIITEQPSGKGAAMKTGFEMATGDLIIMMDADGSHDPGEIPLLLDPILDGFDVAKGSRLLPGGGSADFTPFRRLGNKIFVSMVNTLYSTNYTDLCYGYRAFKKEALDRIYCSSNGFEIETEQSILMKKAGLKIKEVPSFEAKRKNGNSNLNSIRDGFKILNVILKEYLKPSDTINKKDKHIISYTNKVNTESRQRISAPDHRPLDFK